MKMQHSSNTPRTFHRPHLWGSVSLLAMLTAFNSARGQDITPVPPVEVLAPQTQILDGSAAAGYRVKDSTAAGQIWGNLPVQDAPYSITVVPAELIQNTQGYTTDNLTKVIPQLTSSFNSQNAFNGSSTFYDRGQVAGTLYDGLTGGIGGTNNGNASENMQRVEFLSGVGGFLYGTNFLGGALNYVLKRPTATPLYDMTVGDNAGSNTYIHLDVGGPLNIPGIAGGLLGYRFNFVGQDGRTSIDSQFVKRNLVSGAIDINLPYNILLQLDASHSNYHVYGLTPENYFCRLGTTCQGQPGSLLSPVTPINPASYSGAPWSQFTDELDNGGINLTWKANEIFTLRSRYEFAREAIGAGPGQNDYTNSTILDYSGKQVQYRTTSTGASYAYTNSGYTYLDSSFDTFGVDHKVTTGFNGYSRFGQTASFSANILNGAPFVNNFYNPVYVAPLNLAIASRNQFISTETFAKNFVLGDEMKFFDGRFMILAGANYTVLGSEFFNSTGQGTSGYDKAALTPTVSLVYKPLPWLTNYGTYQQSLQPGSQVPFTANYTDPGAILPPYLGNSFEVGAKAQVGTNLLLGFALYQLTKANQYDINSVGSTSCTTTTPCTYYQNGQLVDKGVELYATGKLTQDLTLIAGFNIVDARVTSNPTAPWQVGVNTGAVNGKLYAEYSIPFLTQAPFLQGLVLIGGIQGTGSSHGTPSGYTTVGQELIWQSGYVVCDLGFRYKTKFYDHDLTLRFNVNNVANYAYWASVGPGIEGAPRTFRASAELKW